MKIVVLSMPFFIDDEIETLVALFEKGLDIFHLRKSDFSIEQSREYLNKIPAKFHKRIVTHHHHRLLEFYNLKGLHFTEARLRKDLHRIETVRKQHPGIHLSASLHHLDDIKEKGPLFDYVFLSPIFDSISKPNYKAAFKLGTLYQFMRNTPVTVMALGGVTKDKIKKIKDLGFSGAVVLGSVWYDKSPLDAFLEIKKAAEAA